MPPLSTFATPAAITTSSLSCHAHTHTLLLTTTTTPALQELNAMIQMREVMTVGSLAEKASKLDPVPPKGTKYDGSSWAVQDAEVGQFDMKMMDKQILEVGGGWGGVVGCCLCRVVGGSCAGWWGAVQLGMQIRQLVYLSVDVAMRT